MMLGIKKRAFEQMSCQRHCEKGYSWHMQSYLDFNFLNDKYKFKLYNNHASKAAMK